MNYKTLGTKGKAAALKEEQKQLKLEIQRLAKRSDEGDKNLDLQKKDNPEGVTGDNGKFPIPVEEPGSSVNTEDLVFEEVDTDKKNAEAEKL